MGTAYVNIFDGLSVGWMHFRNAELLRHSRKHSGASPRRLTRRTIEFWGAIDEDDRRDALSLLQWLAFSLRTLSTDEATRHKMLSGALTMEQLPAINADERPLKKRCSVRDFSLMGQSALSSFARRA
jgi:hypothetical protein